MTIIRWSSPARLSDIFDEIFSKPAENIDKRDCECIPAANIIETEKSFEIQIAVPGYRKDDISIDLENSLLSIYCEKNRNEGQDINFIRREFISGTFRRSFTLPKIVESEKITADYKNGILQVLLPKKEEAKQKVSRGIEIS